MEYNGVLWYILLCILVFTARYYEVRGYATVSRLSVRLSVCLSVTFRYADRQ